MPDAALETLTDQAEFLRSYWHHIDQDPEVQKRRAAFEKAEREGKAPEEAVSPSEYLARRRDM